MKRSPGNLSIKLFSIGTLLMACLVIVLFIVVRNHGLVAITTHFDVPSTAAWSFVVAGDDRTDMKQPYPDPTGINTQVLKSVLKAIVQKQPRFMLFTGDLVCGENPAVKAKIAEQFSAWTNLVSEEAPHLTVLPVRGNHEMYGDPDGNQWLAAFKPGLDANNVTYLSGEEGFSYSYSPPDHPEIVVIALDQFMPANLHRVNLVELENALKQARANHASHIFVFAHEMAFTCSSHPDSDNMAAFPVERNQFIELLERYGCEYFFAGHDHAYDWMAIKHPGWPPNYVLNQIVAGTAGAPYYADKTYFGDHQDYDLTRLDHKQYTHGYLLVVVNDHTDDKHVTVTFETVSP
jgi:hypothetical protein